MEKSRYQNTDDLPHARTTAYGRQSLRNEDWMSLPRNQKELMSLASCGIHHPAMKMAGNAIKMKRSPNQVFILLIGLTGAGKSSTVNYLFETNVAKTNDTHSETSSTTEYTVILKSDEWRIPDLKLSFIDTPGLCDVKGLEQDAKNIMSIKYFLELHPCLRKRYPNLVMILLNITDNRITGECSRFAKMLKGISSIKAVDHHKPNVIVVLTHAASIAFNPDIWDELVKGKKAEVIDIVQLHLGITPEIVVQENKPEIYHLQREGDWYLLPNKDKQPKILYQACATVLNNAKDEIGHEAVAIFFRPGVDKNVTKGKSIESSSVKEEDITDQYAILCQSTEVVPTSEVANMLEVYKKEQNDEKVFKEILILQVKLRGIGINKTDDLQNFTMNKLMIKFYPITINLQMQRVLKEVFGLCFEQSAGFDYHVGKGYNIFKDSETQFSPLVMDEDFKHQHGLPANVELRDCSSLEMKCESIKNKKEYIRQRLRELQVDVDKDFNFRIFNLKLQLGYNDNNESKRAASSAFNMSSFAIEYRMQKVVVKQPFVMTDEFIADVNGLPAEYEINNESSVMNWNAFFDKWGMYVVTGAYIGGSLTGQVTAGNEQSAHSTTKNAQLALAFKIALLQKGASADFSKDKEHSTMKKDVSSLHSTCLNWSGGRRETYKTSLENIEPDDWTAWVRSLEESPVPLWSSLDLFPLYHLAYTIDKNKGLLMQKVMDNSLRGNFMYTPPKKDNRKNTGTSNNSGGCFHEESLVLLNNQKFKRMGNLSVGDKIFTVDNNGGYAQDEVIAWLHQVRNSQFAFLQIVHDKGKITLSPEHIIFVGKTRNPQHASSLRPGDELCFFTNGDDHQTLTMTTILSIHKVKGRGMYAPLTYSGRLLVDNVDVSCYCTLYPLQAAGREIVSSHTLAHAGFFPLRLAFKFGLNINNSELDDETGIHGYARWLMKVILGK